MIASAEKSQVAGRAAYRLKQVLLGFLQPTEVAQGGAEVVEKIRQIGLQAHGLPVGTQGLGGLQAVRAGVPEDLIRLGIVAFGAKGDAAGGGGLDRVAQRQECVSAVDVIG